MASDSDPAPPPVEHCEDCGADLASADRVWLFEVESVTRDELIDQRVLCPDCYADAFTTYSDR